MIAVGLLACSAGAGCANLDVTKVSCGKRRTDDDHARGFRYYLSRPYVVVKAPILVCETSTLYLVADRPGLPILGVPKEKEKVMRINPASGNFEAVSDAELAALHRLAARPGAVQQVGWHKQQLPPTPPVVPAPSGIVAAAVGTPEAGDVALVADVQADTGTTTKLTGNTGSPGASPGAPFAPDNPPTPLKTAQLDGNIQIIFLPDLDEQYAIHNRNFLSKSTYSLYFNDGWQLTDVTGDFDSTAVPLEILNFIDTAIDAAKSVAIAGVDRQARALSGADVVSGGARVAGDRAFYRVITSTYLKPGVYRVNKPWEMHGAHPPVGCGLLAKMGLATFETMRVEINPTPRPLTDIKLEVSVK
jgi:hypothetical protein